MSKRSKRHHFVPKVLQKSFCAEGQKIWYAERENKAKYGKPELRNIDSTFRIRNYYTVLDGDEPSDVVERSFYGRIDDYLGDVIPECIKILDQGDAPTFDASPLATLQDVVFEMLKRTPEFTRQHDDASIGLEVVEGSIERAGNSPEFADQKLGLLSDLQNEQKLVAIGRDVRVRGTIKEPSERVVTELRKRKVRWAIAPGKHSFVLSSMIAYRIGNGGPNGLSNPKSEIWLPISPKYVLVLVRDDFSRVPLRVQETRDRVRVLNEFAVKNCSQIGSHSEKLISSLVSRQ